jgi:Lar family restriction alleviation protein
MKIKNCPFCGGKAEVRHTPCAVGPLGSYVRCKDCGAKIDPIVTKPGLCSDDEAIKRWNERADEKTRDPENYKKVSYDNLYLFDDTTATATDILKERDPDENYIDTTLGGLDAYERQLKRWDIKVAGVERGREIIEAFAKNDETIKLFPEYLRRCLGCTHKDVLKLYIKSIW